MKPLQRLHLKSPRLKSDMTSTVNSKRERELSPPPKNTEKNSVKTSSSLLESNADLRIVYK